MERLTFAAIADDDTGASDLAGMLAEQGIATVLIIDLPPKERLLDWCRGAQAVIMAEGTRAIDPRIARQRTLDAIQLASELEPRFFQIKYCSTFDSTERGNIGPTIDAALDELGEEFTIALPALPVNGRTTYMGYHFVHRQLLSDSPMRHHPLTPMVNPNLVDFLGKQTKRKVGLAAYTAVDAGVEALREEFRKLRQDGVAIAVVDCTSDRHVETICRAAGDLRLITGGSAPGIGLPTVWREKGWISEQHGATDLPKAEPGRGALIVAGSCSTATRGQNEWIEKQGVATIRLNARELVSGDGGQAPAIARAGAELRAGRPCLLATSAPPEEVAEAQSWGHARGLTPEALGRSVVSRLAEITQSIFEQHPVGALIAAGGETSGALCRRLELGALRVGRNIEPGVPLCHSLGRYRLPVVLKSGNFGSPAFYAHALTSAGSAGFHPSSAIANL
jgi:3-dehydrotetronate 4-kinase